MKKIKTYVVRTEFSTREIQARSKSEAVSIFRAQLKTLVSASDKITVK